MWRVIFTISIFWLANGSPFMSSGGLTRGNLQRFAHQQPQQIHLSYGDEPTEMIVTWSTMHSTNGSIVEYGGELLENIAYGTETLFIDGGNEKRQQYIHRVRLTNLTSGTKYYYHCGTPYGWSNLFYFYAMIEGESWSPRLVLYGDLGNTNAQSLSRLQQETIRGMYDAVIHIGDFAYDMDTDNARVGDEFMRQIESIAGYLPYMTCPGNHENAYNFSNYKNRFSMPGTAEGMYYSFNMGPIHFIAFSTEHYFFSDLFRYEEINAQYNWLVQDLKEATTPENRAKRPWIMTYGHRPMYCSNYNQDDCTKYLSKIRAAFEDLFYEYEVDLVLWAHEHSYERLWPVYDHTILNGSYEEPYTDPKAPIHITTGSAGCSEQHDIYNGTVPEWSAFRAIDYGYARMQVFNNTHLYFEQVSDDKDGEILDSFWLIKHPDKERNWTVHVHERGDSNQKVESDLKNIIIDAVAAVTVLVIIIVFVLFMIKRKALKKAMGRRSLPLMSDYPYSLLKDDERRVKK